MGSHEASQEVSIKAPAQVAFDTLTGYETLADWQSAIDELEVLDRYPDGMGKTVAYTVDLKVRKVRYTLLYEYDAPRLISFRMIDGDVESIEGSYRFGEDGPDRCTVNATIEVDPGMSVPGPIRRMLAGQMLKGTLKELRRRSEELAAG